MDNKRNKVLTASIAVTLIGIFGKFFGFARDAVIAAFYGANWQTDAFFFAQSMPGIIFPAVCNSLSTAFLTAYVSKSVDNLEAADSYGSKAITFSFFLAITLSILAIIIAPIIVPVLAPGFTENQTLLAISLTRITMAAFFLAMGHYMFGAILSAKRLFYGAQIAALVYNLTVIVLTVIMGKGQNMYTLTWTVVFGHIIQLVILLIISHKQFRYVFSLNFFDDETKALLRLTFPILLGNSIVQINNIVDKVLSSLFGEGAMSALSYSNTLNRFVTGVVITTLSTVIYPVLAEHYSKRESQEFATTIKNSLSIGFIILIPVSIITTICASDIVKIVYERGSFDSGATTLTALALMFYGMMFVFSVVQEITVRAFYAMKDTKTPLRTAAIAIISNAIMSYIFSKVLGMGLGGIALGTTLSTLFAAVLLIIALEKRVSDLRLGTMKVTVLKILVSSVIVAVLVLLMKNWLSNVKPIIRFLLISIVGFVSHFALLLIMRCDELINLKHMFSIMNRKPD